VNRGRSPLNSDLAPSGTRSGWHGWVYSWELHLICTEARVWAPLAGALTLANATNHTEAPALIQGLPLELRFLLGNQHYRAPDLEPRYARRGCLLITPKGGTYPHTKGGGGHRAPAPAYNPLSSPGAFP